MSAPITSKLHRPSLPQNQGQKEQDTESQREHISGPAKSTEPPKRYKGSN